MYKQLILSLSVIKEKYLYLFMLFLPLVFMLLEFASDDAVIERDKDTIITMPLDETAAVITFLMLMTLFFNKQHNIYKYKVNEWYYIQPFATRDLILGDIAFVVGTHLISYLYWAVFNVINRTPEKINIFLMVTAVSLILHSLYLLFIYKNESRFNTMLSVIYTIVVFITFCFHAMVLRNDYDMNLNLSENPAWHFYLYQLPYPTLIVGVISLVIVYGLVYRQFNKKHQLV